MRILVTGGTGFIGSHTARTLAAAGHRVRLLVRDPAKAKRVFAREQQCASFECVPGDIVDSDAVAAALDGCEGVIHCAALVTLDTRRATEVLETNARGAKLVLGGAHRRGFRTIVHVSSQSALFTPHGPTITESSPLASATSAYARSKIEGDQVVERLQAEGAAIRSTYPPAVIGPDDPGLSVGNLGVRMLLRCGMAITSSGLQFLDVRDLADLHVALLSPGARPGRYIAAGHLLRWRDLADRIDALTGKRVRRVCVPGGALRALGRIGDALQRIRPFDFPLGSEAMEFATLWPGAESSPAVEALGIGFRDPNETLGDTLRWLHAASHLEGRVVGRLAAR